jgi:hypothetical protein
MWPWAHVAGAYVLFAAWTWYRGRSSPSDAATVAVGFGALAPDLVDKPFTWYVTVLPNGRTVAHSLLIGGVVVGLIVFAGRRYGLDTIPFAFGYVAHLVGDAFQPVASGNFGDLSFLVWPLIPHTERYDGVAEVVASQGVTPFFGFEVALTVAGVVLWWYQGRPGVAILRRWLGRAAPRTG